jgi:hypothetical protein
MVAVFTGSRHHILWWHFNLALKKLSIKAWRSFLCTNWYLVICNYDWVKFTELAQKTRKQKVRVTFFWSIKMVSRKK